MICFNKTQNVLVIQNVKEARSFKERLIGLLNRKSIQPDEGLLMKPCRQIHTFFMKFAIDAVFLDKQNSVLEILTLKPFRLSAWIAKSRSVLELPTGTGKKHIKIGDVLEFKN